jgi:hypothetical protein
VSEHEASERVIRPPEAIPEDAPEHRRRTARQARHSARTTLHTLAADDEALEDADLLCPKTPHDLGRKTSKPPKRILKPGRRAGFKVWKTTFWKRRRALWAERNEQLRRIADGE